MICVKDHNQLQLFDSWGFPSLRRRQLLDNSWVGLFKDELPCELPESDVKGRSFICGMAHQDIANMAMQTKALYLNADVIMTDKPGCLTAFLETEDKS